MENKTLEVQHYIAPDGRIVPIHSDDGKPLVYRAEELVPLLKVSRSTIFQWLREGKIKSKRCGKIILIPVASVDEFLSTK